MAYSSNGLCAVVASLAVTTSCPVAGEAAGTTASMTVSDHFAMVASAPRMVTLPAPCAAPNPVPKMPMG